MSAEILLGWAFKLLWAPFLAWYGVVQSREQKRRDKIDNDVEKRLADTYTQAQVDKLIENYKALNEQRQLYAEQRIYNMEQLFTKSLTRMDDRDERMTTDLSEIKTNIAILTTKINKRKDD